nr:hypothetical protein [uncultured Mediterranean phage uvMED]BAR17971.1 hypothetical protein [uncultured Mediterranean phage uvMED]
MQNPFIKNIFDKRDTNFYGGRSPREDLVYGFDSFGGGRIPTNTNTLGNALFRNRDGTTSVIPASNRSFSALTSGSTRSAINRPNTFVDPNMRVASPLMSGSNRPNTFVEPSMRVPTPMPQQKSSLSNKASTIGKGLLNFAQSPYGEGFATGLLKAGGFSPRPISFAEALGTAMEQGQKSRADAQKFDFQKEQFDFTKTQSNIENLLAESKLSIELQKILKPQLSNAALKLRDFGIDPNSEEGRAYLMAELESGKTTINLNDKQNFKFNETFFNETLIPKSNELQEKVTENQELKSVYQQMKILLDEGVDTGVFDQAFLGVKRFLRDAGLLTEKQADRVTTQELFEKLSNFTVPRMRVPGSGATSDFEANLFRTATATLGDDESTNKRIIASRFAALNLQQEYADFYSEFTSRFEADSKKSDFSNRKIGDAFRSYLDQNPEVLSNLVGVETNNIINSEEDFKNKIINGTLQSGDMIFSNMKDDDTYNTFVILNDDDIANYREN